MLLVSAFCALGFGAMAGPASAGIWTAIPSGTPENITAIDYQGGDRFWLATANGQIRYREGGVFKPATGVGLPTSITFNDIAFQPGTNVGLAVGNTNNVWRTVDGGRTWTKLSVTTINNAFCGVVPGTLVPVADMFAIAWGPNNVVYLGGAGKTVLRSANAGATFTEVNKSTTGCKMNADGFSDIFFFPSATSRNDEKLYFQARQAFGKMFFTADGLQSAAAPRDESINGTETNTNLAVDPTNTNRLWATNQCGFTCLYFSEDSAANFDCICSIENQNGENQVAWYDVEYAGGTVVVAGRAGQIANSVDGRDFFYNKADGALATKDWAAAAMASGSDAAVGGQGGALVVTSAANSIPDILKPTGTIAGPATAAAGTPVTFTLNAADTGGSGLNPASYSWTSAGLPTQGGGSVSYTFPSAGFYTVKVSFADNAGNAETATKSISVSTAPPPPPPGGGAGKASLPVSFTGPGNSLSAKIVGNRVRIRARGTVTLPAGARSSACKGKVKLTVKRKRTTLAKGKAKLKRKSGKCRFGKTIFIKRSKVGKKTTRLRLKVSFRGNTVLKAGSTTKTLVIKK
jgi:hypothetical protein